MTNQTARRAHAPGRREGQMAAIKCEGEARKRFHSHVNRRHVAGSHRTRQLDQGSVVVDDHAQLWIRLLGTDTLAKLHKRLNVRLFDEMKIRHLVCGFGIEGLGQDALDSVSCKARVDISHDQVVCIGCKHNPPVMGEVHELSCVCIKHSHARNKCAKMTCLGRVAVEVERRACIERVVSVHNRTVDAQTNGLRMVSGPWREGRRLGSRLRE